MVRIQDGNVWLHSSYVYLFDCLTFVKKNCAIINCSVLFIWCNFCYTTHTQNNYSNKCQTENNGYTKQDIFTIELFTINSYDQRNGSDIKRYILSIVDW
jgi:hypothetical protein